MDFVSVIKKRWMCREYHDKDVSEKTIDKILDLSRRFPSAGHTQPQEFIIVRDQETKDALGKAAANQMYLATAPVVIVVVSDTKRSASRYGRRGEKFYSIIDGAFASMLVLLSVVNEGLGAGFVGAFRDKRVQEILDLPSSVRPIGIIPIGHCAQDPKSSKNRREKDKIIHHERYQQ